jgi:hypothetical protein
MPIVHLLIRTKELGRSIKEFLKYPVIPKAKKERTLIITIFNIMSASYLVLQDICPVPYKLWQNVKRQKKKDQPGYSQPPVSMEFSFPALGIKDCRLMEMVYLSRWSKWQRSRVK